jgi:adenosylcobinamide-GDP ribazoletransferase
VIVLRAFASALAFLTRLPVPGAGTWSPRVAGWAVAFYPAVGLVLGGASAGLAWLILDRAALPPHLLWAVAIVGAHAFLTGALHLDGLSDIVDGLGGGRGDRERALEIMKDPRVGAFGVVALILVLGAKVVAMDEVLRTPGRLAALLACPVLARFGAVLLVVLFPAARETGMAATVHREAPAAAVVAAALPTVGLLWAQGWTGLVPAGAALATALVVGVFIWTRLRGLTGDAYGAAIELSELAFLLACAAPRIRGS